MKISLRKLKKENLEMVMNWRMLPQITQNLYTDPKLNMKIQYEWFERVSNDKSVKYWIIQADDKSVGLLWLYCIDLINKRCEWGYFIGEDNYRGKGLARPLECNIYDYVFDILKLNKLHCEVFEFNDIVIKIHEKFGSEVEGVLKQHIYKNGQFYNAVCLGILSEKWHSIKNTYEYEKIDIE